MSDAPHPAMRTMTMLAILGGAIALVWSRRKRNPPSDSLADLDLPEDLFGATVNEPIYRTEFDDEETTTEDPTWFVVFETGV